MMEPLPAGSVVTGGPDGVVGAVAVDAEVPRVDRHGGVGCAFGAEVDDDAAVAAEGFAVAVARVGEVVDVLRGERDQPQPVADELVGYEGGVGCDFDDVDRDGWDF